MLFCTSTLDDDLFNITSVLDKHESLYSMDIRGLMELALEISKFTLRDPRFLKLLEDPTEKFDAVLVDLFETEVISG